MNMTNIMSKKWWIVLGVVVVIGLYWLTGYNRFVGLDQQVVTQWAQVETQYQRRFDLIPNLVNSVKGIMNQEQEVFSALADARTKYSGAANVEGKVAAANQVESALGRLLVVMENYPQLRSTETVQTLMAQLEGTENRISVERSRYNDDVQVFNTAVLRFPSNLIAKISGFSVKKLFEAAKGSEKAPEVSL